MPPMKKTVIAFFSTLLVFFALVFSLSALSRSNADAFKVAMVTDFSDVNDQSFNQACYEGGKEWAAENNIEFNYYKPSDISLAERIKSLNLAIDRGYKVILCPGFALGEAIANVAPKHPDVKFIGLDISPGDFPSDFTLTENIAVYNYHEEIAGYLAGYGIVKEGFRRLGFLGGMPSAAVIRFGYGYVQGIDAAARELEENVELEYVYGGQFYGDSEIFKYIDNWYKVNKTEVVFSCGGGIYTSVALSAKENEGYMIGVDSDQSSIIDKDYGEGICITSAMKGIKQTVIDKLNDLYVDHVWESGISNLGLVSSENPERNYVQLPMDTWRMKNFTIEDYKALVADIMSGEKTVSTDVDDVPSVSEYTKVFYRGSIK